MSKIPRSFFVTPTSKLPVSSASSAEHSKPANNIGKIGFSSLKKVPLSELTAEKRNIDICEKLQFSKSAAAGSKRNAVSSTERVPSKQIKISNKPETLSVSTRDFKVRFNDISEKYNLLQLEYSELKKKFDECSNRLESAEATLEAKSASESKLVTEIETLSEDHKLLLSQYQELKENFDREVKSNREFFQVIEKFNLDVKEFELKICELQVELNQVKTSLLTKSEEFDCIKQRFEKEVLKCSQLNSIIQDNEMKVLSCTSEITFLKSRQKTIDQKNEENCSIIANLKQDVNDFKKKLTLSERETEILRMDLDEKVSQLNSLNNIHSLQVEKNGQLENAIVCNNENILSNNIEIMQLNNYKQALELGNKEQSQEIECLQRLNSDIHATLEHMHESQKILRNTIQDLKGHIRVFCRIRPPLPSEKDKPLLKVDVMDSCSMEVDRTTSLTSASGLSKKQSSKHNFTFDGIFPPNSLQSEVFNEVAGLIQSALDGYNVCIFAYGQTGSGKTYTMEGGSDVECSGIIPRAIDLIFSSLPNLKKIGWEFTIKAAFLEIYNENIYDLLDCKKNQNDHSIKMVDNKCHDVYVANIQEEDVACSNHLLQLLRTSQKNRQTAATVCNERSSRSHSVTKIKIAAYHEKRGEKYTSILNLVDLAGSESAKTSQRMDETKSINKSLSELSKVILALKSKQGHIPYRNSKLTYLLMPCLGGNSKTLMLVNVAQSDEGYSETLNSLRFAAQVNSCQNGVTKKNISTA